MAFDLEWSVDAGRVTGLDGMVKWFGARKCDTFCDTLVLGVLRSYKDLGSHRGLVSC
jgi:hypothetical protein